MQLSRLTISNVVAHLQLPVIKSCMAVGLVTAALGISAALAADTAQLTVADGVVVKFGPGAGISVRDRLHTGTNVVFTSDSDDAALGAVYPQTQTPAAGDWLGVLISKEVNPSGIKLDGLAIRYAGGSEGLPSYMNGGAALVLSGPSYSFNRLQIVGNAVGIRVIGSGSPAITQSRISGNGIGLLAEQGATPSISESDISGNLQFGVRNTNAATPVLAKGNWWGHASGPRDAVGNPAGQGNPVSTGVDYGNYLTAEPVLACTMAPTQGYVTRVRTVELSLDCPQAASFRIQETDQFGETLPWQNMGGNPTKVNYTLSTGSGDKMLYVQFRTAQGKVNQFALSQPVAYAPEGPVVQFSQPAANAVLDQNTSIVVTASDAEGVRDVEILVNDNRLALLTASPYQAQWSLAGVPNGNYTLKAKATNTAGLSNTATRIVQVQKQGGTGPAITATFAGQPLRANATITQPGLLGVTAESPLGVTGIKAAVNGVQIFDRSYGKTSPVSYSQMVDFAQLPNGAHSFSITATDADGMAAVVNFPFTLNLSAPSAPAITQPTTGATVSAPLLNVSGTAMPGSQVQLFLNGQVSGSPVAAAANGSFSTVTTLPTEGVYQIEATAANARGTSPKSAAVAVTYTSAAPTVSFVAPAVSAVLSSPTSITVVASAPAGIAKVDIYANDTLLASPAQAPYSAQWDVTAAADGAYTLKAVATSAVGKTTQATRQVTVKNAPVVPEPPKTPYTGTVSSITPSVSYGTQPIVIVGTAVTRDTAQLIPNAALRMVLDISGFKRRINIATDASGQYRYEFVPTANDNGTYIVSVIHPEETATTDQGRFTINRLSFSPGGYNLTAARDFASTITINARASAGSGATGVRWAVVPADQPSGSLPPGITVDVGPSVNIAAGATVPMAIRFTGNSTAGEAGTVILTAFAAETGSTPRGSFTIDYKLVQARPDLFAKPTFIETGVQQESTVTEGVVIGNRGLVAAQNVRVRLTDNSGNQPPTWVFLASGNQIGAIDVGGEVPIQVIASPGKNVADGIYNFRLIVTADNSGDGTIPVSVAVTQSGQGGVSFHITDMFTDTLNTQGQSIKGVEGGRIRLQNEAVPTDIRTFTSDAAGRIVVTGIPPGTYVYRASGPRHADKTGRVFVRPGVTITEQVHLKYQTISIDFSVNETTIQDVYNINLEATFQTQVPAPVVLLEPLSINIPELQVGEEVTGELTLTNYGLVRADNVKFTPPQSDEYYKYEFLAEIPKELDAKKRLVIPYRITATKLHPKMMGFTKTRDEGWSSFVQKSVSEVGRTKAASCSSYAKWTVVTGEWVCVNGVMEDFTSTSTFSRMVGGSCSSSNVPSYGGGSSGVGGPGGGGWGGGYTGGGGAAMPLTPACTPHCGGNCCNFAGQLSGG